MPCYNDGFCAFHCTHIPPPQPELHIRMNGALWMGELGQHLLRLFRPLRCLFLWDTLFGWFCFSSSHKAAVISSGLPRCCCQRKAQNGQTNSTDTLICMLLLQKRWPILFHISNASVSVEVACDISCRHPGPALAWRKVPLG